MFGDARENNRTGLGTEPAVDVITGLKFLVDLPGCDPSWVRRMKEKNR